MHFATKFVPLPLPDVGQAAFPGAPAVVRHESRHLARCIGHLELRPHRGAWHRLPAVSVSGAAPALSEPETDGILAFREVLGDVIGEIKCALVELAHMRGELICADTLAVDEELKISEGIDVDVRLGWNGLEFHGLAQPGRAGVVGNPPGLPVVVGCQAGIGPHGGFRPGGILPVLIGDTHRPMDGCATRDRLAFIDNMLALVAGDRARVPQIGCTFT